MSKALVVIDIQNDITKNYKNIVGKINESIERAKLHISKFADFFLYD